MEVQGSLGLDPTNVPVNAQMVKLARLALGLNQREFAEKIGLNQARLSRIEDNLTDGMPIAAMQQCVKHTGYPQDFFVQEGWQKPLRDSFFRKRATIPAKTQNRAEALINIKRMEIEKLLAKAELEPELRLPHWAPDEFPGGPKELARQLRVAWGIPRGPVENLTKIVEAAGCVVVPFDFGTPKIDGVSTTTRNGIHLIFMNSRVPAARYRLTLAHELVHAIMHDLPTPDMEEEAFAFAAEFLVPESEVRPTLFPLTLEKLSRQKLKWGVSMQFILRWALQMGAIKDSYYKYLSMLISKEGWKLVEPYDDDMPVERPALLPLLIGFVRKELEYTAQELRALLKANERTFHFEYAVA